MMLAIIYLLTTFATVQAEPCGTKRNFKCQRQSRCPNGWSFVRQVGRSGIGPNGGGQCSGSSIYENECEIRCETCASRHCNGGWQYNQRNRSCQGTCPKNTSHCCNEKCANKHCTGHWTKKPDAGVCSGACSSNTSSCCQKACNSEHCSGAWSLKPGFQVCPSSGCPSNSNFCCQSFCQQKHCTGHFSLKSGWSSIKCPDHGCDTNTEQCCQIAGCDEIRFIDFELEKTEPLQAGEPIKENVTGHEAFVMNGKNCGRDAPIPSLDGIETTFTTETITEDVFTLGQSTESAFGLSSTKEMTYSWDKGVSAGLDTAFKSLGINAGVTMTRSFSETSSFTKDESFTMASDSTQEKGTSVQRGEATTFGGLTSSVPAFAWHEHIITYHKRTLTLKFSIKLACINAGSIVKEVVVDGSTMTTGVLSEVYYEWDDKTDECEGEEYQTCMCFPNVKSTFHKVEGACQFHTLYGTQEPMRGCYVYKNADCGNGRGLADADPSLYPNNNALIHELTPDFPVDSGMFEWSYMPCDNNPRYAVDDGVQLILECSKWLQAHQCDNFADSRPGKYCVRNCSTHQCCGNGIDLKINFQPDSVPVPMSYIKDTGAVFAERDSGFRYGWSAQATARDVYGMRSRESTSVVAPSGGSWQLTVPNGVYDVELGFSDPENGVVMSGCMVEGVPVSPDTECEVQPTQTFMVGQSVAVEDGQLTLSGPTSTCESWAFLHVNANMPGEAGFEFMGAGICCDENGTPLSDKVEVQNVRSIGECRRKCLADFNCEGIQWRALHTAGNACWHYRKPGAAPRPIWFIRRRSTADESSIKTVQKQQEGEICEKKAAQVVTISSKPGKILNLGDVIAYDANNAEVKAQAAVLSTTLRNEWRASNCIDGDQTTGCHSSGSDPNPTLTVQYPMSPTIERVVVRNRPGGVGNYRIADGSITLVQGSTVLWSSTFKGTHATYEFPQDNSPTYTHPGLVEQFPVQIGSATDLGITNSDFTAMAWVYRTATGTGDYTIFGTDQKSKNKGLHLLVRGNKYYMGFYSNDCGSPTVNVPHRWEHVAFVYEARTMRIYVNGQLKKTCTNKDPFQGTRTVHLGRWAGGRKFVGKIQKASIWSHALSQSEILEHRGTVNRRLETDIPDEELKNEPNASDDLPTLRRFQ